MTIIEEKDRETVELKLIQGGKTNNYDWLSPLKCGTIFLYEPVEDRTLVIPCRKVFQSEKGFVRVFYQDEEKYSWKDPKRWCVSNHLLEVLLEGEE